MLNYLIRIQYKIHPVEMIAKQISFRYYSLNLVLRVKFPKYRNEQNHALTFNEGKMFVKTLCLRDKTFS